jgi:hypothetical protein
VRARGLGQEEHPEDVGLEGAAQLRLGDVGDVLVGMLLAGIVHQHVDPAEFLDHLGNGLVAERLVADIAGDGQRLAALAANDPGGLRGVVMLAQIEDRDVGALARIERGDGAADAAVGAGDQRDLALEAAGAGIAWLPFGLGLERALMAGQRVFVDHLFGFAHGILLECLGNR